MEDFPFFLFFFIVAAGLIAYQYFFSKQAILKRKLKKKVAKELSQFKDGAIAKIIGTIEFVDPPLLAPLSYRKCALYYVHVEEKVSSGKNSHWDTIIEKRISSKFLIKDGDHYAYINALDLQS